MKLKYFFLLFFFIFCLSTSSNGQCTVTINQNDTTICSGSIITLVAFSPCDSLLYSWDSLGISLSSNDTLIRTLINSTSSPLQITYRAIITDTVNMTSDSDSVVITVLNNSTGASGITVSNDTICPGDSDTLMVNGGSLGAGAKWKWYTGSCGGTLIDSGATIYVTPNTTTEYFVRAEGICNTTGCDSVTIHVRTLSTDPTMNASVNPICESDSTTLSVQTGTLGTGAVWKWYLLGCGDSLVHTGQSYIVSPGNTIIYYLRGEGICNVTNCDSIQVNVNNSSKIDSVLASTDTICLGDAAILSVYGTLGTNAVWKWYKDGCGGVPVANSVNQLTVSPDSTTEYYVRAEGTASPCNSNTLCKSVKIIVKPVPSNLPSINFNSTSNSVCKNTHGLNFGVSNASSFDYNWTVNNGAVIIGENLPNCIVNAPPSGGSFTIILTATNSSGCSKSVSQLINISASQAPDTSIVYLYKQAQTLICLNNTFDHYQWGYDDLDLKPDSFAGEIYQDFYVSNLNDTNIKYFWVKTFKGNCYTKSYYNPPLSRIPGNSTDDEFSVHIIQPGNNGEIKINLAGSYIGKMIVSIFNVNGQLVYLKHTEKKDFFVIQSINMAAQTNGMYFLNVRLKDLKPTNKKFILSKF